ncbi:MAG: methyltransferase domain-containing protein [Pseudomonadota bacterium]
MTSLRVRYQTIEFGETDIHLRMLRDKQQFEDADDVALNLGISSATWPIFGVVWASGMVLAHLMHAHDIKGLRILEVGCGIGLASLVLNNRHANITATDYHPEAGPFLRENVLLNQGEPIPFVRTGWADSDTELGLFDLIIGSDVLYEHEHAELLSRFIERHTRPLGHVILVDPGRGNHARFSKKMVSLGYSHSQDKPDNTDYLPQPFKGQVLRYQRLSEDPHADPVDHPSAAVPD